MKYISTLIHTALALVAVSLFGCGGGGGGSTGENPGTGVSTVVSGIASKGLIQGGTVSAFKIVNNIKGDLLATAITGANGSYTLDLGSYTGAALLEISGGTYTDEATGASGVTIPASAPLHAVVSSLSGTVPVAITPLTELAFQLAGTSLTPAAIVAANAQVSSFFKVTDIIKTLPVSPTQSALAASTQAQQDYTLVLATLSQVAATKALSVADTVTFFKNEVKNAALSAAAVTAIQNAAATYFTPANIKNTTGITDPAGTKIATIVPKQVVLTLATSGTLPAGKSIKGVQFEIKLPTGFSVKTDTGGVLPAYLQTSGLATAGTTPYVIGNATGSNVLINFTSGAGIGVGEFATLICDLSDTASMPTVSSFAVSSGYKVTDTIAGSGTINLTSAISVVVSGVAGK